jgi:hypothetical protein
VSRRLTICSKEGKAPKRIGSISAPYKLNPLTTRRQSPQILV